MKEARKKIEDIPFSLIEEVRKKNPLRGISYYGVGPVYSTISKKDAQKQAGTTKLKWLVKQEQLPLVAIDGINLKKVQGVWQTRGIASQLFLLLQE